MKQVVRVRKVRWVDQINQVEKTAVLFVSCVEWPSGVDLINS